ncbi:short-chain dehydrogenase/reductase SDR [Paenibacillus curdlanolyticus YK9]|uniref:Short-chain dehydrogenase/reductase SDR n=1 Tax=Paenibacillus curdlanolyticus YK9 TaxID=717606 RepID=E0I4N4_9BACL|nr:SDR family oxidoreductase [Paenibacillus curdlanolyticus]EFM12565.1 short-chain dehydrogenase/reductase SDR [Paenibacillus curdlanolyticus YK9]
MGKTVLITGASSGIGKAFADIYAGQQATVVLASRNEEKLEALATQLRSRYSAEVIVIPVDLAQASGPQRLFDEVHNQRLMVDVLINNAGVGSYGFLHEQQISDELAMLQLNVHSLAHLMMLFLPEMVNRRSGQILNIGSTTSFYPCPLSANYSASKAFVLYLTEAAANELRGTGVTVTALCPGGTGTAFFSSAKMDNQKVADAKALMDPRRVAEIGVKALNKRKIFVVPGLQNWLLTQAPRFLPRSWVTRTTRSVIEQKR